MYESSEPYGHKHYGLKSLTDMKVISFIGYLTVVLIVSTPKYLYLLELGVDLDDLVSEVKLF